MTHQVMKMMHNIRQYQVPLQKYMAMMDLQVHTIYFNLCLSFLVGDFVVLKFCSILDCTEFLFCKQ